MFNKSNIAINLWECQSNKIFLNQGYTGDLFDKFEIVNKLWKSFLKPSMHMQSDSQIVKFDHNNFKQVEYFSMSWQNYLLWSHLNDTTQQTTT